MARRSRQSPVSSGRRSSQQRIPRRSYTGQLPSGTTVKLFLLALVLALIITGFFWLKENNWDLDKAWNTGTAPDKYVSGEVETGFDRSNPQTYSTASDVLAGLPVKERSATSKYNRVENFGEAWMDVDNNSCDTRNDVLVRDLTDTKLNGRCKVLSGVLIDPYTSEKINFTRGEGSSQSVPIDHVVALSNAWSTGGSLLSQEDRQKLANDPLNLQATSNTANSDKSDKDAASWLPQKDYRCEYVARQVSVKKAYGLWVTKDEKKAMENVLSDCPDQPAFYSTLKK